MSLPGRLLIGGLFAVIGVLIEAMALGLIPVDQGSIHAPLWVLLTIGGMFALVGVWILAAPTAGGAVLKHVVGPVVLLGLLSVLHWVAFGPGVRQCSGSVSIPFLSTSRPAGDLECRIAFGYGALFFDGLLLGMGLSSFAEKKLRGRAQRVAKAAGTTLIVVPLAPFILVLMVFTLLKAAWMKVRGA